MGERIAAHILAGGYSLVVYNRDTSKTKGLKARGAKVAPSPKQAAENADVVMVMVTDDKASQDVWLNERTGAIQGLSPDAVAIDLSTLSVAYSKTLAKTFKNKGIPYFEAPVIGSRPQAEAKTLVALVGGPNENFDTIRPLLECFSARVNFLGAPGKASAFKLGVNALLGIQASAFAEVFATLMSVGYEAGALESIFSELPITSPIMKNVTSLMLNDEFKPLFPIALIEKDLGYAEDLMVSKGLKPRVVKASRESYKHAMDKGFGENNISGVIQILKEN